MEQRKETWKKRENIPSKLKKSKGGFKMEKISNQPVSDLTLSLIYASYEHMNNLWEKYIEYLEKDYSIVSKNMANICAITSRPHTAPLKTTLEHVDAKNKDKEPTIIKNQEKDHYTSVMNDLLTYVNTPTFENLTSLFKTLNRIFPTRGFNIVNTLGIFRIEIELDTYARITKKLAVDIKDQEVEKSDITTKHFNMASNDCISLPDIYLDKEKYDKINHLNYGIHMGNIDLSNGDWYNYERKIFSFLVMMFESKRIKSLEQYKDHIHFDDDVWTRRYHKTRNLIDWYILSSMKSVYDINKRIVKIISEFMKQYK